MSYYFWSQYCSYEEQNGKERFILNCSLIMQVRKAAATEFSTSRCMFGLWWKLIRAGFEVAVSTSAS